MVTARWRSGSLFLCVRNILNKHFPGRWIGGSSSASPTPLAWPPRSPDLTTPDNALWGITKDQGLFAAITAMTTFAELWRMRLQPSLQNYSNECLIELGGAFDCVLKITVNTLIFLRFNARAIDVIIFHLYANL